MLSRHMIRRPLQPSGERSPIVGHDREDSDGRDWRIGRDDTSDPNGIPGLDGMDGAASPARSAERIAVRRVRESPFTPSENYVPFWSST